MKRYNYFAFIKNNDDSFCTEEGYFNNDGKETIGHCACIYKEYLKEYKDKPILLVFVCEKVFHLLTNINLKNNTFADAETVYRCKLVKETEVDKKINEFLNIKTERITHNNLLIDDVIFNEPATIVKWADGTKTVVKAQENDKYDKVKGLALAFVRKATGNKGNYYDIFDKWVVNEGDNEK